MNIRPPISSSQTIYYAQSLPIANVVKPRILLQKQAIPMLTSFPRSNSHYSSPVVYKQQNQENLLKLSNSNKEIYYSPPPVYSEQKTNKIETRQRNLSPEAVTVLDILSKIKNTNTFQINKQKIQIKAPVNIQNEPPPKENIPPKQIIEPTNEVKTSTFKRSCNCSPKSSPKNRNLPDISFPIKTDESDPNSDVKVYKINLKTTSNPVEVTTINPRGESPKRGESSPKKFGVSPKQSILLKNDSKDFSKNEANPKIFDVNNINNSNMDPFALNNTNSKSDLFQPTIAAKNSNIMREGGNDSTENRTQILNSNKIPSATNIANNQIKDPQNFLGKINKNPQIDVQTEENGKDKGPIQNLLGKINECLSKTSNILNKTYEETKNELPSQHKSLSSKENNNNDIGGENLLKITTSPVKEVQLELSDAITIQSQFNDTLKSFNANPTTSHIDNVSNNLFPQCDNPKERISSLPKKNDHEIIEIDRILENTAAIYQAADSLNPQTFQGKTSNNENGDIEILNSPNQNQRTLRDNFSPIIEKSERDEDKENNSPFINVYTGKSPKNLKEQAEEILRVSSQENRVPTSPPNKNSNVSVENPYNKEAVGLIMQSPSEAPEKPVQRVIQASVNTSNFIKNKKDTLNNKISPKTDGKRKIKSEKKITSVSEMYHNNETKNPKEKPEKITAGSEKRTTQEINMNKPNTIKVDSNNEKGSYAKIAQKYQKNTKEPSIKQNQILNEITTIDQEIENLERDAQKDKIDQKMLKFYDNYKAYKHKLPSIQENDESMKRKTLLQTPLSSSKTFDKKKPYTTKQEEGKIVKKEQKINDVNNKIVQERCNYLYAKAIEVSQKKQKEIEENQKKKEIAEKNICTFKPEFISKKNNENILQNKDKIGKPSLKSLKNYDHPRGLKRTASQNLTKVSKNVHDTIKMNKSMSPPKNSNDPSKNHSKKQQQSANHSAKPWISPRSTSSSKTRRMSKETLLKTSNGHLIGSPNPTNNILRKAESNFVDPHLNGEIFDILKIFSGINEVLVTQKEAKTAEIQGKEQGKYTFEKLRDLSPIKPTHNLENSQNNKSFNENSINEISARNNHETRTSLEKVLGLLDQKHQDLLLKSVEMTKKVDKIFKENSVYVA